MMRQASLSIKLFNTKKSLKIYQRGNQNPKIEEQATQWPNEIGQKDKQRSTKHTHKTKDRVIYSNGLTESTGKNISMLSFTLCQLSDIIIDVRLLKKDKIMSTAFICYITT